MKFIKYTLALVSAVMLLFVTAPQATAEDCVSVKVVVLGQTVNACVPVSSLPTVKVTIPGPTVKVTGPTVSVPGPTVTRTVPGETEVRNVPGPVVTRRVTQPRLTTTATTRQTFTTRGTVTSPPKTVAGKPMKETITVTKFQAVGLSIVALVLGGLLALLLLYSAYKFGWVRGDGGNRVFLKELRDSLTYNRQH